MNRRQLLAAFAVWGLGAPFAAIPQAARRAYRIGLLSYIRTRESFAGIVAALRGLGYVEGQNTEFLFRFAEGDNNRLSTHAADLVAKKVDLIVCPTNTEILAAKRATASIPIVMLFSLAPVEMGLIASFAHPGSNVTGTTIQAPAMGAKFVEILRDTIPRIQRIAILWEPNFPGMEIYRREADRAAEALKIKLTLLPGGTLAELESALKILVLDRPDALYVVPTGAIYANVSRIIGFAASNRLPAIYPGDRYAAEGGLMSYAADGDELTRQCAAIADRILKGANPADLPVEQPTRYRMVVNLKTANALGLKIPQNVLLRADEVIE